MALTRRKFVKLSGITALGLATGVGLFGCGKDDKETNQSANGSGSEQSKQKVKIAYLPITHALPLYVANELGKDTFKNVELELIKFGSWPELLDALNTGNVDGASLLIELAMAAKEQGSAISAVALGHRDGNVVVTSPDIKTQDDLKGKTFAIPHRLSTHNILLYQTLKNAGLTFDDVTVIELPPPEMPAALAEGRIAGYVVAEPFGAISVAKEHGKVFHQSEDLWQDSVCCGLVLRDEFIRDKQEAALELLGEYVAAGEYIDGEGERVSEIAKQYMNVEQEVLDLSLGWISYNDLKIYEKDYGSLGQYMVDMGLSKRPPTYEEFVDNSLIDKVRTV